jgi:hypothetical protein
MEDNLVDPETLIPAPKVDCRQSESIRTTNPSIRAKSPMRLSKAFGGLAIVLFIGPVRSGARSEREP